MIRFDTERPLLRSASENQSGFHNGFYPLQGSVDIASPPDHESKLPYDEHYFGTLGDFQLLPKNLAALDEILERQSATTQVMIAEMPVPETFFYYYGNGEQDHQTFIDTVKQEASAKGILFLETTPLQLFPSDVWFNYNHLNSEGAPIFSDWFGRQLGKAVQEETINFASG